MIYPDTTWGEMREIHRETVESGWHNPDDWLSDPETREESAGKRDDEYIYDISEEEAERWAKIRNGEPIPDITYSFTLSDDGKILELIKTDADEGVIYMRVENQWVPLNENSQNPRVFDRPMVDIRLGKNSEAIKMWDANTKDLFDLDITEYMKKE